jgi:CMP-N-acetylneuraminic acid synthetase
MKNILGVITARGGSKGIPFKNIKPLGGKPLIAYTIDVAKKSKLINHLIVSTDDKDIADVCIKYGANVPFMRPAELAQDGTPHVPVMQHAIDFIWSRVQALDKMIQETEPFKVIKIDEEKGKALISQQIVALYAIAEMLNPLMPKTFEMLTGLIKENKKPEQPLFKRF